MDQERKTRDVLAAEKEATKTLSKLITEATEENRKPITIMIGRYRIENVFNASADQIKGDPKADIALLTERGREVGFISHKKAGGAKAYQQYGGISRLAGRKIYDHPLVEAFVRDLEMWVKQSNDNNVFKSGQAVYRKIPKDPEGRKLVGMSVYGPEWSGGAPFNRNSVHCIGQGTPILTKVMPSTYSLTFSESIHTANDLEWAFRDKYAAILAVTYRGGRKVENKGLVVRNARPGIYPYDFVVNRNSIEI
jgi:hypothetical protein